MSSSGDDDMVIVPPANELPGVAKAAALRKRGPEASLPSAAAAPKPTAAAPAAKAGSASSGGSSGDGVKLLVGALVLLGLNHLMNVSMDESVTLPLLILPRPATRAPAP